MRSPRGKTPKPGPQVDRQTSCPEGGPTTLKKMAERNYDYRPQMDGRAHGRMREGRMMKGVLKLIAASSCIL